MKEAKLIEGAKKEGKLIWYASTNVTESKPLLDDFEKQYPFIKGELFRASGEVILIESSVKRARANGTSMSSWSANSTCSWALNCLHPTIRLKAKISLPIRKSQRLLVRIYVNYRTIG